MTVTTALSEIRPEPLSDCIYLDNAATTQLDRRVLDAIYSVLVGDMVGNPHSKHHSFGDVAAKKVQSARERIACSVNASPNEIVFTSGATESNNLVINGLSRFLKSSGKTHIITNAIEHKSVLGPLKHLENEDFRITILPVKPCGMVEAKMIEQVIDADTGLVCIQAVNNEIGTIQPIAEIAEMLAGRNILLHCDAAQALGKIPFDVASLNVDFASFSAHKVHGPQGIGALYVKSKFLKLLDPLQYGGGQEYGLRSGTLPVALCAGFGAACAIIDDNREYLQNLRTSFLEHIKELSPIVYGHQDQHWNVPGILNIRFPGIDCETLVMALSKIAFGIGSACNSSGNVVSHVIKSITGSEQAAKEAIRLSFSRMTTKKEIELAANQIITAITEIKQLQGAM